jgi:hypothetical protein
MITDAMTADELHKHFKAGDIVFFFDKNNPDYLQSRTAQLLRWAQGFFEVGDNSTVHVGLILGLNPHPVQQGETPFLIIDSMPVPINEKDKAGVNIRPLIRNYSIEIFRLKAGVSPVDSSKIANTAVKLAQQFIGMGYSFRRCQEVFTFRSQRENTELNEYYTRDFCKKHLFDPKNKTIEPDLISYGMNCSEAVITWYQLAVLMHSEASIAQEQLPSYVGIHAHASPAKLHHFMLNSGFYEKISIEATRTLRFSGRPDPRDHSMAIVEYIDPAILAAQPQTWTQWITSALPTFSITPTLEMLRLLLPTQHSSGTTATELWNRIPRLTDSPESEAEKPEKQQVNQPKLP